MRIIDGYNLAVGALLTMLAEAFHQYGVILATFLIFNILDWITGTCKARFCDKESSVAGLRGICKKLGYWILLAVAFLTSQNLVLVGQELGIALEAAQYLGGLTLAMLVVNEARSITENLVEMGIAVPEVFTKGLAVAKAHLDETQIDNQDEEK